MDIEEMQNMEPLSQFKTTRASLWDLKVKPDLLAERCEQYWWM